MWSAIYMAEGITLAEVLVDRLQTEGFLVKKKPFGKEGETLLYEILVPEFEAEEAQSVLLDFEILE